VPHRAVYFGAQHIKIIKLRQIRYGTCSIRGKEKRTKFWEENLEERHHLEDIGVGGRIILKWI
jgi:hypothetical protein